MKRVARDGSVVTPSGVEVCLVLDLWDGGVELTFEGALERVLRILGAHPDLSDRARSLTVWMLDELPDGTVRRRGETA